MEASQELSIVEVSAKLQSNKELYTILITTGNLYLPPISYANQSYLRGVCNGQQLCIRCSEVKVVKVPHAKGLEVASILKFAFDHFDLIKYLPEYEYQKEPSREWVGNLVNTLIHDQFQEYMNDKISETEAELSKQKNLFVNATPEIIDIIKRSNAISTSKGKSHFLLRSPIKRKSKRQIEQEKMKAEADENYVNELQDKLEEMRSTIEQFDQINEEAFENK